MPLFGKSTTDSEWVEAILQITDGVNDMCDWFALTGRAVVSDPIQGWRSVATNLAELPNREAGVKSMHQIYKKAGTPEGAQSSVAYAKTKFDEFFSHSQLAIRWGKFHIADASGGPGMRAITESGFAQRAAFVRVANNGRQFAENALAAADAGRSAVGVLKAASGEDRPSLADLFLETGEPGTYRSLADAQKVPLAQRAVFGSWCYSQAAILGMIVSANPDPFIATVWNPTKVGRFWEMAEEHLGAVDARAAANDSLPYMFMQMVYPQLYGEGAISTAVISGNAKAIEKLAGSTSPLFEARMQWALDTASGLALGVRRPAFVWDQLEVAANPDRNSWAEAHAAGVDIPPVPDAMSVDEQIETVVGLCLPFFEQYYPEAAEELELLVARLAGNVTNAHPDKTE